MSGLAKVPLSAAVEAGHDGHCIFDVSHFELLVGGVRSSDRGFTLRAGCCSGSDERFALHVCLYIQSEI